MTGPAAAAPLRVLLVDDEAPARARLRRLLLAHPQITVVAEARDGVQALHMTELHRPDALFLDVQMPEADGLAVAASLPDPAPAIVFVTAFDHYALPAFDAAALDYLLKPVARDRLQATVQRLQARVAAGRPDPATLDALLQHLARRPAEPEAAPPLAWITANSGRETRLIMLDEVAYFRADSKYTVVVTAEGEALLRTPLKELLEALDPRQFRQVHRSTIVNLKAVASVVRDDSGKGTLRLKGRSETLPVSVPFMALFKGM